MSEIRILKPRNEIDLWESDLLDRVAGEMNWADWFIEKCTTPIRTPDKLKAEEWAEVIRNYSMGSGQGTSLSRAIVTYLEIATRPPSDPVAEMGKSCNTCKWCMKREKETRLADNTYGIPKKELWYEYFCHRYPMVKETNSGYWCGEYQKVKELLP